MSSVHLSRVRAHRFGRQQWKCFLSTEPKWSKKKKKKAEGLRLSPVGLRIREEQRKIQSLQQIHRKLELSRTTWTTMPAHCSVSRPSGSNAAVESKSTRTTKRRFSAAPCFKTTSEVSWPSSWGFWRGKVVYEIGLKWALTAGSRPGCLPFPGKTPAERLLFIIVRSDSPAVRKTSLKIDEEGQHHLESPWASTGKQSLVKRTVSDRLKQRLRDH